VIANFLHNITNIPPGSEEPLLYLPFNTIVIGGLLGGSAFFLGKALFVDIKYWSEKISQIIEDLKK